MPDSVSVIVVELSKNSSMLLKIDALPEIHITKAELLSAIAFIQQRRAHIIDINPKDDCNVKTV